MLDNRVALHGPVGYYKNVCCEVVGGDLEGEGGEYVGEGGVCLVGGFYEDDFLCDCRSVSECVRECVVGVSECVSVSVVHVRVSECVRVVVVRVGVSVYAVVGVSVYAGVYAVDAVYAVVDCGEGVFVAVRVVLFVRACRIDEFVSALLRSFIIKAVFKGRTFI